MIKRYFALAFLATALVNNSQATLFDPLVNGGLKLCGGWGGLATGAAGTGVLLALSANKVDNTNQELVKPKTFQQHKLFTYGWTGGAIATTITSAVLLKTNQTTWASAPLLLLSAATSYKAARGWTRNESASEDVE